eukprot:TRINITY_DN308_c0_g1_i1.p1 TRINITY_DN308_c0_g1~~TRINITY_DN308_c0_g1_i1.p1  ORF type:complete len:404 (-),score=130.37 TRINITY_DN308_c0_g1_i1:178-1389(-)
MFGKASIAVGFGFLLFLLRAGIHQVEEGHVGVYYRGGALLKRIEEPGFHFKFPFIDHVENVQITAQTDSVRNIPCGTSGGVVVMFDRIEVVNQLQKDHVWNTVKEYSAGYDSLWIFEKIHHEINQFCSSHTLSEVYISLFDQLDEMLAESLQRDIDKYDVGIRILTVRVTKPRIPESIRREYEQMEEEKAKLLIMNERQKVVEREAEIERKRATIIAQKEAEVSRITMEKEIQEQLSHQRMEEIQNEMFLTKKKALADAEFYRAKREADANRMKLTREYLQSQLIESVSQNTKIYFGKDIPSMLFNPHALFPDMFSMHDDGLDQQMHDPGNHDDMHSDSSDENSNRDVDHARRKGKLDKDSSFFVPDLLEVSVKTSEKKTVPAGMRNSKNGDIEKPECANDAC